MAFLYILLLLRLLKLLMVLPDCRSRLRFVIIFIVMPSMTVVVKLVTWRRRRKQPRRVPRPHNHRRERRHVTGHMLQQA